MSGVVSAVASALLALGTVTVPVAAQKTRAARADNDVSGLPLHLVTTKAGSPAALAIILTGDGGWAGIDKRIGDDFAARGVAVVGLDSRSYLMDAKTPDEAAADVARVMRHFSARWSVQRVVLVGYSRGADMAPFVVNRWPEDLRRRVRTIAFVGLSERASFEFHFEDLMFDVARPTDIPTRPEVAKLAGIRLLCVQGADEQNSFCAHPVEGMQTLTHPGKHRATSDEGVVPLLLRALDLAP
jgi:type IV secretory pathway VirJ component